MKNQEPYDYVTKFRAKNKGPKMEHIQNHHKNTMMAVATACNIRTALDVDEFPVRSKNIERALAWNMDLTKQLKNLLKSEFQK